MYVRGFLRFESDFGDLLILEEKGIIDFPLTLTVVHRQRFQIKDREHFDGLSFDLFFP